MRVGASSEAHGSLIGLICILRGQIRPPESPPRSQPGSRDGPDRRRSGSGWLPTYSRSRLPASFPEWRRRLSIRRKSERPWHRPGSARKPTRPRRRGNTARTSAARMAGRPSLFQRTVLLNELQVTYARHHKLPLGGRQFRIPCAACKRKIVISFGYTISSFSFDGEVVFMQMMRRWIKTNGIKTTSEGGRCAAPSSCRAGKQVLGMGSVQTQARVPRGGATLRSTLPLSASGRPAATNTTASASAASV